MPFSDADIIRLLENGHCGNLWVHGADGIFCLSGCADREVRLV